MRKLHFTLPFAAAAIIGACSSSEVTPSGSATGGASSLGSGGKSTGNLGGNGSVVATGGGPSSGGASGGSPSANMAGAAGGPGALTNLDYEGINLDDVVVGVAPTGCVAGPDALGHLTLQLETPSKVVIQMRDGQLFANDVSCGLGVNDLTVLGSPGNDIVVFDRSTGGGLPIANADLAGGTDALWLRGSSAAETVGIGSDGPTLRFSDETARFLSVSNGEAAIVSSGPGADRIFADGQLAGAGPSNIALAIFGGADNDEIVGGSASDQLHGGAGLDTFRSPSADGADTYDGGPDQDILHYTGRSLALVVTIGAGANDGVDGEGDDIQDSLEDVNGGSGNDHLTGSAFGNELEGADGNDTLIGGDGNDTLSGDAGNDTLAGGSGDDTLYGLSGQNQIDGGSGEADVCSWVLNMDTVAGCEL